MSLPPVVGALQARNNLADVASPSAALANLGGMPLAGPYPFTGPVTFENTTTFQGIATFQQAPVFQAGMTLADNLVVGANKVTIFAADGRYVGLDRMAINGTTGGNLPTAVTGTQYHSAGANSVANISLLDAFNAVPGVYGRRANGTDASPTAVASGNTLFATGAAAYRTNPSGAYGSLIDAMRVVASETATSTAMGRHVDFLTVPNGTTSAVTRVRITEAGTLLVGTTTDNTDYSAYFQGAIFAKRFVSNTGALELIGPYSQSLAPLNINIGPINRGTPAPVGNRDLTRISISNEQVTTENASGIPSTLTALTMSFQSGTTGAPIETSWKGNRRVISFAWSDNNYPASYLNPGYGNQSFPSTNVINLSMQMNYSRGGRAPTYGLSVGSSFPWYSRISLTAGGKNYNNARHAEMSLMMDRGSTLRGHIALGIAVEKLDGIAPVEFFRGISLTRSRSPALGFTEGFQVSGNTGLSGMDPWRGRAFWAGSSFAETRPIMYSGLDLADAEFRGFPISWPGGRIAGGDKNDLRTGGIQVGAGWVEMDANGLTVLASGWRGPDSGTLLTTKNGGLVDGDIGTGITARNNSIFDCVNGGIYAAGGAQGSVFSYVEVLTSPIVRGGDAPSTNQEIYMRPGTGGAFTFVVTDPATTTTHDIPYLAEDDDFMVSGYLWYRQGVCKDEIRKIISTTKIDELTTRIITEPFTTSPTESIDVVENASFKLNPLAPTPNTVQNHWSWDLEAPDCTVSWAAGIVALKGNGTDASLIDQYIPLVDAETEYTMSVTYIGRCRASIGSAQGGSQYALVDLPYPSTQEGPVGYIFKWKTYEEDQTSVWLRIFNPEAEEAEIYNISGNISSAGPVATGVRADIVTKPLTIHMDYTYRDTFTIQPDGTPTKIGGKLNLVGVPTSASGLVARDVYIDAEGFLRAVLPA